MAAPTSAPDSGRPRLGGDERPLLNVQVSQRALYVTIGAVVALIVLIKLWPIVLLVVSALIFMAALLPYVEWLVHKGIPRTAAVLLLFVAFLAMVGGLLAAMVPAMLDEFEDIRTDLPADARRLEQFLDDFGIEVELEERAREFRWSRVVSGSEAIDYGQRILFTTLSIFTVVVMTVYLLIDTPRLSRFIFQFVPPGREPQVEHVLQSLSRVVGGYVRGQLITSLCISVFTFFLLLIVGVPNPLAFAVLAGFADIIPLVGAFIATAPPVIAAFDISVTKALIVLIALLCYQQFEDRYLTPRVYGATLNLPPLIVLLAILAGGHLFGIAGILLALPTAAVARVALDFVLDSRTSGGSLTPLVPADEPHAPDDPVKDSKGHG